MEKVSRFCFLLDCRPYMDDYKSHVYDVVYDFCDVYDREGRPFSLIECYVFDGASLVRLFPKDRADRSIADLSGRLSSQYKRGAAMPGGADGSFSNIAAFIEKAFPDPAERGKLIVFGGRDCVSAKTFRKIADALDGRNATASFVHAPPQSPGAAWVDSRVECLHFEQCAVSPLFADRNPVTAQTLLKEDMRNKYVEKRVGDQGAYCNAYRAANGKDFVFLKESYLYGESGVAFDENHVMQWSAEQKSHAENSWRRETEALSRLSALSNVPRTAFTYEKNNTFYIGETYYAGATLAKTLEKAKADGVSPGKIAGFLYALFQNVAELLCYTHSKELVHGDVSVNNVLVKDVENADDFMLADWGQARAYGDETSRAATFSGGNAVVDPWFSGKEVRLLHPCNDVYKLGHCAYKALRIFYGEDCALADVADGIFLKLIARSYRGNRFVWPESDVCLYCSEWVEELGKPTGAVKYVPQLPRVWQTALNEKRRLIFADADARERPIPAEESPQTREVKGDPALLWGVRRKK